MITKDQADYARQLLRDYDAQKKTEKSMASMVKDDIENRDANVRLKQADEAYAMRRSGLTYKQIGVRFNFSIETARSRCWQGERRAKRKETA